ncbi:MAG TPA: hypothetical protein VHB70_00735 [Parafilimonas sp.]|nr:hypothetical protein [Parafilimonas sp.]
MKKTLSISIFSFLLISFAACKKDSGGSSGYYVKANVGGTQKNYTSTPLGIVQNDGGSYSLTIEAGAGGSSLEGLALEINQTSGAIAAGTYDELSGGSNYAIASTYNPGSSDVSAIFGAGLKLPTSQPLQIVITSISNSQVSGTFSGEYYDNSGTGTDSLLVSNGSFNVPIQ